jgi:hypothetical protein
MEQTACNAAISADRSGIARRTGVFDIPGQFV